MLPARGSYMYGGCEEGDSGGDDFTSHINDKVGFFCERRYWVRHKGMMAGEDHLPRM